MRRHALAALLADGQPHWIRLRGESMRPVLTTDTELEVGRVAPGAIALGDLVVFEPEGANHLVCHRVVGRERRNGQLVIAEKGDGSWNVGRVPAADVLARVRAVRRGDRRIGLDGKLMRVLAVVVALTGRWSVPLARRMQQRPTRQPGTPLDAVIQLGRAATRLPARLLRRMTTP